MPRAKLDLHMHSTCSDGKFRPTELVDLLVEGGVTVAALTDHDTTSGIEELEAAATPHGIRIIPGAEVSVEHRGQDLHILAYFLDRGDPSVKEMLEALQSARKRRMLAIIDRLGRLGMPVTYEQVRSRAESDAVIGRPHLAETLQDEGWIAQYADAFRYYIGGGGPGYEPKETLGIAACLEILLRAGAIPVLAHPGVYRLEGLLEELVPAGLLGIEVYHPSHSNTETTRFEELAREWGLIRTGGSDFHGSVDSEITPGAFDLGEEILEDLERIRGELPEIRRRLYQDDRVD